MQAEDIIRVKEHYYIIASSPVAEIRTFPLKQGRTFGVFDRYGDILPLGRGEQGLYRDSTRFLNRYELRIGSKRPLLLSSAVRNDNSLLTVDLANPDVFHEDRIRVPRESVHIYRCRFLWRDASHERIRLDNFTQEKVSLTLNFHFDADFADIFEIRGSRREKRGRMLEPSVADGSVTFGYLGLDGIRRTSIVSFDPPPSLLVEKRAEFGLEIEPDGEISLLVTVSYGQDDGGSTVGVGAGEGDRASAVETFEGSLERYKEVLGRLREGKAKVYTSNERFNDWINRSSSDLYMMLTETEAGLYPAAGIPWYCNPFGRDGILTALQCLWMDPEIARGVLLFLADNQAREVNNEEDAEPGKILHEFRVGEMANTGEIPFGRYYGSVDATPLFVFLAGAYYGRTGDIALIRRIWPNVLAALDWIDRYGDADEDGFVEYSRHSKRGLTNQGWKDSWDAVFHADGTLAEGPIALVEVQGYVYAAKTAAARLAGAMGHRDLAEGLEKEAARLRDAFEDRFWTEEKGTYALALDGKKRQCRVRSSNAGHCLFTGIADPPRARKVVNQIMRDDFFSGWGIRTVAATEARYNPMSYHNGSVWPHDNAFVAAGMIRYGAVDPFMRLFAALFDASLFMDGSRLPELFCGFKRREEEGPTLYPVACYPQAWASGASFLFLQACLGLSFEIDRNAVVFNHPHLPSFLQWVQIRDLAFQDSKVDLLLGRYNGDVVLRLLRKDGPAKVVVSR
jgi:glycogen debranching enzyme